MFPTKLNNSGEFRKDIDKTINDSILIEHGKILRKII